METPNDIFSMVTRDWTDVHQEIHDSLLLNPRYKVANDELVAIEESMDRDKKKRIYKNL